MGFIIGGFIWDIPILIFAYVLFWGPIQVQGNARPDGTYGRCPSVGFRRFGLGAPTESTTSCFGCRFLCGGIWFLGLLRVSGIGAR